MKKTFYIIMAAILLVTSCKKEKPLSVTGCWSLQSIETKALIGDTDVQVYVEFASDKTFSLYQKLGEGRFRKFSGTWKLAGSTLDGSYSDGKAWAASYTVSRSGDTMTLTGADTEVSTYGKIDAIPSEVVSSVR